MGGGTCDPRAAKAHGEPDRPARGNHPGYSETLLRDGEKDVTIRRCGVLGNQTSLPGTTIEALVMLLQRGKEGNVQFAAAKALRNQTSLPETTIEERSKRSFRIRRGSTYNPPLLRPLGTRTSLPKTTIEVLKTLLQDEEGGVRSSHC